MNLAITPDKEKDVLAEELFACLEIGKVLTATRNHKKIFEHIMRCGIRLIKAQHWSILIRDRHTGTLKFEIVVGADKTLFEPIILGPTEGIAPHVAQTGHPMFVPDVSKEPLFNKKVDMKTGFETRSIVCLPLTIHGHTIGVIEIVNIEDVDFFSKTDYPILSILADFTAIAIDNSMYLSEIKRISVTDEYTGLSNARFMHQYLDDFFQAHAGPPPDLSVIFMDIDNFKTIVDTYGHLEGSELLKKIGAFLMSCMEEKDILIKYGGDEFIILLPLRNSNQAFEYARRLSERLSQNRFSINNDETVRVTGCFGVASFPEHAADKKNLLIIADNALFKAKKTKKNSIGMA